MKVKRSFFIIVLCCCLIASFAVFPEKAYAAEDVSYICNLKELANYTTTHGEYLSDYYCYSITGTVKEANASTLETGWFYYPYDNKIVFYQMFNDRQSMVDDCLFMTVYIDNFTWYEVDFTYTVTDPSSSIYGSTARSDCTVISEGYEAGDNFNFICKSSPINSADYISGLNDIANMMAKSCIKMWNEDLQKTIGFTIADIGFIRYTNPSYKTLENGHTFGDWSVVQEATESKDGRQERVCKYCGTKESKSIPATGHAHDMKKVAAKDATCTEQGNKEYYTCSKCGLFYSDANGNNEISKEDWVLAAKGHSYGEWVVSKEATQTTDGEETRTCKTCGNKETRVISKNGENHTSVNPADEIAETEKNKDSNENGNNTPGDDTKTDKSPNNTDSIFVDVSETAYYKNAANWAAKTGVTAGIDATHFGPNQQCTRAQVMTFLWKANGSPEPKTTNNPFTDVKTSNYYYKPVLWAVENGITSGTTATTFSPNAACTRGQVVTFLWHSNGDPQTIAKSNPFGDVKSINYYYYPVLWAIDNGITSGTTDKTFSPNQTCTRAQIVTFIWKSKGSPNPQ